ncbi:MAG TPA: hypothetical protein VF587_09040 [Solirubrobacteraceae bacterium]|jgi:hypothetical protein
MSRLLLLALVVAWMLPASAAAAPGVTTGPLEGPVVLVEDGAMWIEDDGRYSSALMAGRTDGTRRRLLSGQFVEDLSSDGDVASVSIYPQLWTATIGGEPQAIEGLPSECASRNAAKLDGAVMVVSCGGYENHSVVVRRPGGAYRTFPAGSDGVAVAGRYAAWTAGPALDGTRVVLYDALADREVLRAGTGRHLYPIALQPDGTMLLGIGGSFEDTGVAWVARSSPRLHEFAVSPLSFRGFARDRVLALELDRSNVEGSGTRLVLLGLNGSRRVVASTRGLGRIVGAHYDGSRIAVATSTCNGSRISIRSASGPAFTPAAPRLCKLILSSPPTFDFNTRDRPRIAVRVRCPELTLRVCDDLVVRAADGRKLSSVSYLPGFDGGYNVYLNDAGVRRIAREGSMPVRLEMIGDGRSWGAGALQMPATATLRAEPEELARLRRCIREESRPAQASCPD